MNLPFADSVKPMDMIPTTSFTKAVFEEGLRQMGDRVETRLRLELEEREETDAQFVRAVSGHVSAAILRKIQQRIDLHQEAVVQALMENQDALERARIDIERLLDAAHVLPDGRRVFKSEDGSRVIDEYGHDVGRDEINPDMIPDHKPTGEQWLAAQAARDALLAERDELFAFQERLDAADARIGAGGITQRDLDEIGDLLGSAPPRVQGILDERQAPTMSRSSAPSASQLSFDAGDLDDLGPILQ